MGTPEGLPTDVWRAFRSATLWAAATDESVERLARASQPRVYSKGQLAFTEGQETDRVCVLVTGHARGVHHAFNGRTVVVETLWPDAVLGSIEALSECEFVVDIEAVEESELSCLPVGVLKEVMRVEPTVAMSAIRDLADRWIRVAGIVKTGAEDVRGRVAAYLSSLERTPNGPDSYSVILPTSRVELAAVLGTAPETLSRAFHSLQDDGIISADDRFVTVLSALRLNTDTMSSGF